MNIICAILTGLKYLVQSVKTWAKRTKISKKCRREKAIYVTGAIAVAAVSFSCHNVHAYSLKGEEIQMDDLEEDLVEEPQKTTDDQMAYGLKSIIQGVLFSQDTISQITKIGTSFELVLVGQRVETREILSDLDFVRSNTDKIKEMRNQAILYSESQLSMTDEDYNNLLRIVEAEAGGEDMIGKILVANVIFNRVKSSDFPSTVTEVVWQNSGGSPQFSPTADGRIYTVKVSDETREAVNRAIDGEDHSRGALYFVEETYAEKSNMKWFRDQLKFLFRHGEHDFYTAP